MDDYFNFKKATDDKRTTTPPPDMLLGQIFPLPQELREDMATAITDEEIDFCIIRINHIARKHWDTREHYMDYMDAALCGGYTGLIEDGADLDGIYERAVRGFFRGAIGDMYDYIKDTVGVSISGSFGLKGQGEIRVVRSDGKAVWYAETAAGFISIWEEVTEAVKKRRHIK